ncbi:MAG: hypothetical protein JNK17_04625 [Hydrogenophaga sp.]|nr:hypothetical protein [Hydrogenophaga sp.]
MLFTYFQPKPTEQGVDLQGVNLVTSAFDSKELPAMQRRTAMRLATGSALGLVLAACGGGGGGADSSSGDAQALRDAFAKLQNGMVWTDVEALVGFPANNDRSDTDLVWVVGGVRLSVGFYSTGSKTITTATIKDGDSVSRSRDFD